MIRSTRIPAILDKVCDDNVLESCLLVTAEGELLGVSHTTSPPLQNPADLTSLLADIASQYQRLGEDFGHSSHMNCLILEMEQRVVGISACSGIDCLVIGVARSDAPLGLLRARLQALAAYVQDSLSTLTEGGS